MHITNSHNFLVIEVTHLHNTKVACFVCGEQPFCGNNMMGSCWINNPLNIILSNMLTLLLFNREHQNILMKHNYCSILLIIILFIFLFSFLFTPMPTVSFYVTIFPTMETFSHLFKLRSTFWLWPFIGFGPIIKPSASIFAHVLHNKSLILCII